MRKIVFSIALAILIVGSQGFTARSAYKDTQQPTVSYVNDIAPIMKTSCTPCHFPPEGRKEALDSYERVKKNIVEVIERIKLPHDNRKFMPKGKNPVIVNDSLVKVLETWQAQNMPE